MAAPSMGRRGGRHQLLKIAILGTKGVGKTAITNRLVKNYVVECYDPTLEVCDRKQMVIDDEPIMIEVMDTGGESDYTALQEQWIKDGESFMIVYSISSRGSLEAVHRLHKKVIEIKKTQKVADFPICIVGNKIDLSDDLREITREEGREVAETLGCGFEECSAKEAVNVDPIAEYLVRKTRAGSEEERMRNEENQRRLDEERTREEQRRKKEEKRQSSLWRRILTPKIRPSTK